MLSGIPASKSIVISGEQGKQVVSGLACIPGHRSRKTTKQRENRWLRSARQALQHHRFLLLIENHQPLLPRTSISAQHRPENWDYQGLLLRLTGSGSCCLPERQAQTSGITIPLGFHRHVRCSRLVVPEPELLGIKPKGLTICRGTIHNRCHKIFGGGGFTVMTLEKQGHATHETLGTEQGPQHADQFGTFLVNGGRVEIINSLIRIRLNRVSRWPCIFSELRITQHRRIINSLQWLGMKVGGETLITKHRQAFFERQLKPVTTGDSVARPVMEILMPNNTFNALQFSICCGFSISKNQL